MNQIEDLQGRILAAMERIGSGVDTLEAAKASAEARAVEAADTSALEDALEEVRIANAQLTERVKVLRARQKELEAQAGDGPAAAGGENSEDIAAMKAELELLRNEAGNSPEAEALKQEVARLKSQLEVAQNTAATEKETLEVRIEELETANAELIGRLEGGDASGEVSANMEAAPEEAGEMLVRLDTELQQLRLANEQLRTSNAALREANAEGLGDASLINAAMAAEIDGLRAAQASDKAQVNAVLARLEPLLAGAPNLPKGEEV